jgi:hypothetical protein
MPSPSHFGGIICLFAPELGAGGGTQVSVRAQVRSIREKEPTAEGDSR